MIYSGSTVINGILTSGNVWQFFCIEGSILKTTIPLHRKKDLEKIVGILNNLFHGASLDKGIFTSPVQQSLSKILGIKT